MGTAGEWLEKALMDLCKRTETGLDLDREIISGLVSYCELAQPLDAKEYLDNIIGQEVGKSVIAEYLQRRGLPDLSSGTPNIPTSKLHAYVKPRSDEGSVSGTKKPSKTPKEFTSASSQAEPKKVMVSGYQVELKKGDVSSHHENWVPTESSESRTMNKGNQSNSKKKKAGKVISLAEAAKGSIVFQQGKPCLCQARQHRLISNCLSCGKIVCEQEGEGPCQFCGALVLKEGSTYAGLEESLAPLSDAEAAAEAYAKRLVEYDRNSAARTTVIDDQSDYYEIEGNSWLSKEEKDLLKKKQLEIEEAEQAKRNKVVVTFDLVGRKVMLNEDEVSELESENRILLRPPDEREVNRIKPNPTLRVQPIFIDPGVTKKPVKGKQANRCLPNGLCLEITGRVQHDNNECIMAMKGNSGENRTRGSMSLFIVVGLCCFFYILGAWQRSGFGKGDSIALEITKKTDCSILSNLNYETHHGGDAGRVDDSESTVHEFKPCDDRYIDYTPCQDQMRAMLFPRKNMNYRERHCPPPEEKLHCLIPAPKGYANPFRWPQSRDFVPYANAPYKSLTVEKAVQNWIQYEGNVFRFPGGGTQFPQGADAYIDELASVIPMDNGMVRTALDTGCGVASWGAYLFKKNVITMSFAPRDSHEAQVQFALERGVPAIIGVLGTIKLPYPARAFDMAHCSRCLIPWSANDGMYMMEVDRVLRPGGYWILSGPPINWRNNYQRWQRPVRELEEEQKKIEEIAKLLCWEKKQEKGETAVWQKRINYDYCQEQDSQPTMCESTYQEDVWYKKMEACVTPYPETTGLDKVVGGPWKSFPERLNAVAFRISSGSIPGITSETFQEDNRSWKKHVNAYKRINKILDSGRYRNIMDMNAGLGSFAAALESPKLWVMNVMPTIAEKDTLGVIYERGLIGIYHDWCEAFSTYPRTYDLIHANGIFSLYKDKCSAEDILLEMDRILRPEGAVIFREQVDVLTKVKKIVHGMRWNTKIVDHEDGPLVSEKILFAVKRYWVAGETNTTSSHQTG